MTDIIGLVLHDHHVVAELFDKLQAATAADDQSALFAQVKDALERHASAEEKVLYPRVRKEVPDRREESKDAIEKHDQIRGSLKEVEDHQAGTELFALAVAQLVATTKHHIGVEESELLADFRKNSHAGEREELGRQFAEVKTRAPAS